MLTSERLPSMTDFSSANTAEENDLSITSVTVRRTSAWNNMAFIRALHSPDQITGYALACIDKELQKLVFHVIPEEVEQLTRIIKETTDDNPDIIRSFLEEWGREQFQTVEDPAEPTCNSLVLLFTRLIEHHLVDPSRLIICSQMLNILSQSEKGLRFIRESVTVPVVLGAMSAHVRQPLIQEQCAAMLANVAGVKSFESQKFYLKESAIDIFVRSLTYHKTNYNVVQYILECTANLAEYMEEFALKLIEDEDMMLLSKQCTLAKCMSILSHIENGIFPIVEEIMKLDITNLGVTVNGKRIISFYKSEDVTNSLRIPSRYDIVRRKSSFIENWKPVGIIKRSRSMLPKHSKSKSVSFGINESVTPQNSNSMI